MAHFCAMSDARSRRKVSSAGTVAIEAGRRRDMTRRRTEWAMFPMVAYAYGAREHLVVVSLFPPAELRACAAVLDAHRALHVLAVPAAGLAELHLPLVPPAHRLADAAGSVHHACARAAARARPGGGVLGGDGEGGVLHGAVRGRACAARRAVSPPPMQRQSLVPLILGVCVVNGIFSPYLNLAIAVTAVLLPELFPRTVEWVLFWSSILLSTATLLLSGVPAALYERLVERDSATSVWIWLAGAV